MGAILKLGLLLLSLTAVQLQATKNRIFDGQDLRQYVHKYLVKLELYNQNSVSNFCSGSILTPRWVISAAHCFTTDLARIDVMHLFGDRMKCIAKGNTKKVVWHPEYDFSDTDDSRLDVALFKTRKAIEFNKCVQPIGLAKRAPKVGSSAIIAGFGDNEETSPGGKEGSVVLAKCPKEERGVLCTWDVVRAGDGDSGGALVAKGRLVGVTSASCHPVEQTSPCLTIYVNVAKHVQWIKEVIQN